MASAISFVYVSPPSLFKFHMLLLIRLVSERMCWNIVLYGLAIGPIDSLLDFPSQLTIWLQIEIFYIVG